MPISIPYCAMFMKLIYLERTTAPIFGISDTITYKTASAGSALFGSDR